MRTAAGFAVVIALGATSLARAQQDARPSARLVHQRAPGAEDCPDDRELRDAVSARLGYDPFRDDATRSVGVRFEPRARGLVAQLDLPTDDGAANRRRELTSATGDCDELARSAAISISLAIDPMNPGPDATAPAAPVAVPAPVPAPPVAPKPVAVVAPAPTPPPPLRDAPPAPRDDDADRLRVRLGASARGAIGAAPVFAPGFALEPGVRWGALSISLDGRLDLPVESTVDVGRVRVASLSAALRPCGHTGVLVVCVSGSLGEMRAHGLAVDRPREASALAAAAGLVAGVEVPLSEVIAVGARAEVLAALTRVTLRLDGAPVWEQPPIAGALSLGLIGTVP